MSGVPGAIHPAPARTIETQRHGDTEKTYCRRSTQINADHARWFPVGDAAAGQEQLKFICVFPRSSAVISLGQTVGSYTALGNCGSFASPRRRLSRICSWTRRCAAVWIL